MKAIKFIAAMSLAIAATGCQTTTPGRRAAVAECQANSPEVYVLRGVGSAIGTDRIKNQSRIAYEDCMAQQGYAIVAK